MYSTCILHVGETGPSGEIDSANWDTLCDCASEWINEILIFCNEQMDVQPIVERTGIVPRTEPFPDPDAPLRGYRFGASGAQARAVLSTLRFDASVLVTHLFLLHRGSGDGDVRLLAELEVGDGANFAVLRVSRAEEDALTAHLESVDQNLRTCEQWRLVIDGLVEDGELWVPLGRHQ